MIELLGIYLESKEIILDSAKNYYNLLEVPTNADLEEIHESHIRIKNAYSSDALALYSLMDQDECQRMLDNIEEAYMVLSDENKRKQYDKIHNINEEAESLTSQNYFTNKQEKISTIQNKGKNLVRKIVAGRKFSLDYEINPQFEKDIKNMTEFAGEVLRTIREYKSVDISRMSELTRVSEMNLRYIEDEDYTALPASVYVRGFVYQYAQCLRLPPDIVATSYANRLKKKREEDENL